VRARILILSAGFGEGHNAAARALAAACDAAAGAGTARIIDGFALAAPRLNAVARRAYLEVIVRAPKLWSAAYRWLDRSPLAGKVAAVLGGEVRVLADAIRQERPTAICSTYPVYAFLLREIARTGQPLPPQYNVVTDSISINSLWWRAGSTGWFVPNADSARVLRDAGVEPRRIYDYGFPVADVFTAPPEPLAPPDPGSNRIPRVLYIVNSGSRTAAETARKLLTATPWDVTCTVGRNEGLRLELSRLAETRKFPTRVLGWTSEIPALLMSHHVVISKAGGATTQEALAARCPMIVNQIVPGQEEGNYELLRRHGVGTLAETPEAVLAALDLAFAGKGKIWREWRQALAPLARPQAAADIARFVLERVSVGQGQSGSESIPPESGRLRANHPIPAIPE